MARSSCLKFLWAVALALISSPAFAGQVENKADSCPPPVPVTVLLPDGRALIHLDPNAFEAQVHGHKATISALDEDLKPKRIVLLLDASKNVNAEAWKIETSLAEFLLDGSPPQTSFAVVFFNADAPPLDFTTPRATLRSKVSDFANSRPADAKEGENIYNGLMSGLKVLGSRQFGDTIFAFVGGADDSGRTDGRDVEREFIEHGARLFGFVLGQQALSGFYVTKQGRNEVPFDPDTDEIGRIAVQTGGLLVVENTRMQTVTYHLTDERLNELQTTTHHLYTHIVTPYRIQIATEAPSKPENWSITLSQVIKSKVPGATVLFPHQLLTCAPGSIH